MDSHTSDHRPLVSVIIPCFNGASTITRLIESLQRQSLEFKQFEVICVDNGSSDNTVAVINEFIGKVPFDLSIVKETNKASSYAARNKGIESARGEIFFFTDADCIADLNCLKEGVSALQAHDSACVCGGEVKLFAANPEKPSPVEMFEMILGFSQERNISLNGYSVTANLFCWRSIMDAVGPFNDELRSKGDYEWCKRASDRGYSIVFAGSSVVFHPARRTLSSIIIKTRRVTGGQFDLKKSRSALAGGSASARGLAEQVRLVLQSQRFPKWSAKIMVFLVAGVVFFTKVVEQCRLFVGGSSERR